MDDVFSQFARELIELMEEMAVSAELKDGTHYTALQVYRLMFERSSDTAEHFANVGLALAERHYVKGGSIPNMMQAALPDINATMSWLGVLARRKVPEEG